MNINALSVANYFVELAQKEGKPLHLLGLVKRVYIAHGFSLAIYQQSLLDPRFDKVEAWRYGPVIPSVYHSFKQYKAGPILDKAVVMEWDPVKNEPTFPTPTLMDSNARKVVEMVWKRYRSFTDGELVNLTHKKGSPWGVSYVPGKNVEIIDEITKLYYTRLIENTLKRYES